jgi:HAD superfamily hydrolase (TIGR01509 family)
MSTRKTVIFDLGGVLLHWQPQTLMEQLLPHHAPDRSAAQALVRQVFQGFDPDGDWALFDRGRIQTDALAQRIARRTGLPVADLQALIAAIPPHLATLEDTEAVLHELRAAGHRLCFLSNMPAPYAQRLLEEKPFFSAFEDGLFSAHVQQIKPEAAFYALAVERFGLGAGPVWFIDDVQRNLDAAQTFGWHGVRFESAGQVRAQLVEAGLLPG